MLTFDDMKEMISLGWTIFGISITIFLIWNVVAMEYLGKKKPQKTTPIIPIDISLYIERKGDFYSSATMLLGNVNLLLVNLMVLAAGTVLVYIALREATIFSQSVTYFVVFLCINSLVGLFVDILKPFNEQKRQMLKETKVTNEEIDLQNKINIQTEQTLKIITEINKLENVDIEERNKIIAEILNNYVAMFCKAQDKMSPKEGD